MKKIYDKTTGYPIIIIALFSIMFIVALICKPKIPVNYDMNDYLPDDSKSTVSIEVMEEEFEGGIPNARVMIRNVTIPQALKYKEQLKEVEGVSAVTWLDDSVDITQPLEIQDSDMVESYYKNGNALFTVTVLEDDTLDAVSEIREIIGEDNAMTGSAVSTAVATEQTVSEITKIAIIAVIFIFIVLILTTTSWFEPVVIMIGLGVAVIINAGSNIIFGEISFVTNAAGMILQLAVSLDYSVFLLHRFRECRNEISDTREAMVSALCKSTGSILSSGLTTVIGFLALGLMRFKIGPDLGFALAKGVAISLLSVFLFVPAFVLLTYKWIDATQHPSFVPKFNKFGSFVRKIMIPMVCVFLVIIIPVYLASNSNSFYYGSSHIFGNDTELGRNTEEIEEIYGKQDTYVLLVPNGNRSMEVKLSDELKSLPQVTNIISYVDTVGAEIPAEYLDADIYSMLVSENYSRMVITADVDYEGEETFDFVKQVRETAEKYYGDEYYLAGGGVSTYDLMKTVTSDMVKVNLIAIGAVFLILILTMKSMSLPVILVIGIETAIWLNLSLPYFMNWSVFYIAYLIISSVQLGATVDYAILMTDRYLEFRHTLPKKQAVTETISAVTVSILTSGSVLTAVGLLMGYISTHGLLAQLGRFLGVGAIFSLVIVLFVIPGLLYIFDSIIQKTTKNADFIND